LYKTKRGKKAFSRDSLTYRVEITGLFQPLSFIAIRVKSSLSEDFASSIPQKFPGKFDISMIKLKTFVEAFQSLFLEK